jgi:adenosine deaminase
LQQLPTYSLDNIDEVMALSKQPDPGKPVGVKWSTLNRSLAMPQGYNLIEVFDYLSKRYLLWVGGKVVIKRQHMLELHALGLRMPLAFMIQHFYVRGVANGDKQLQNVLRQPESMNLLPSNAPGVWHVVDRGLSEGHLHLNSIHATENNWAEYLLRRVNSKPKTFSLADWRLLRFARLVARTLALATALARANVVIKAEKGRRRHQILDRLYFSKNRYEINFFERQYDELFNKVIVKLSSQTLTKTAYRTLFHHNDEKLLGLYYWLDPWRQAHWPVFFDSEIYEPLKTPTARRDYLSKFHLAVHLALIQTPLNTNDDTSVTDQPLNRSGEGSTIHFLHRSLFRHLIAQTHHWQLGVQQGRTTGLGHFKQSFDSNQRNPINASARENAGAAFERVSHWRGLEVLEGRIAPPTKKSKSLMPWLEAFARGVEQGSRIKKFGLIIHFIKTQTTPKQCVDSVSIKARYYQQRSIYQREAFHLFYLMQTSSVICPFIVGIDAANLELVTPPEVFAPIFRFLRDAPIEIRVPERFDSFANDNRKLHKAIKRLVKHRRLGMTYHVGEEFRHLLSGLRAIDEVLEFLNPQPGDRIGHGLALGLAPQVWLQQTGAQMLMPKQEWLDTLVWIYHYLGPGDNLLTKLQVESQIECLGREIYQRKSDSSLSPLPLWNVWQLRQLNPDSVQMVGNEIKFKPLADHSAAAWRWDRIGSAIVKAVCAKVGKNPPLNGLKQYWYSKATRAEGDKLYLVDMEDNTEDWIAVCQKMQQLMQQRVIDRQMIVETNPSSNLSIGSMSRLEEHPIFNMAFDENGQWQRRLRMTVNTDNPGTSNTSLAHEYYLLGEALVRMKYPEAEAEAADWLEWLRRCGKESSFVAHLPAPDDPDMARVIEAILAQAPKKPIANSAVRLNQWFEGLLGTDEGLDNMIEALLQSKDQVVQASLLKAIIRKAVKEKGG